MNLWELISLLDICINKNHTKQQSSSSISDHDSEETGKGKYKKEIVEHSKIDKPEVGEGNSLQQNHPKCSVRTENTEQSDWHIESETTFKSVLLNKTIEESLIYRKKYVLSKDVNAAISNKSPSRKNMRSHRKSEKEMTSEPDSSGSKQKMVSFQCFYFCLFIRCLLDNITVKESNCCKFGMFKILFFNSVPRWWMNSSLNSSFTSLQSQS